MKILDKINQLTTKQKQVGDLTTFERAAYHSATASVAEAVRTAPMAIDDETVIKLVSQAGYDLLTHFRIENARQQRLLGGGE